MTPQTFELSLLPSSKYKDGQNLPVPPPKEYDGVIKFTTYEKGVAVTGKNNSFYIYRVASNCGAVTAHYVEYSNPHFLEYAMSNLVKIITWCTGIHLSVKESVARKLLATSDNWMVGYALPGAHGNVQNIWYLVYSPFAKNINQPTRTGYYTPPKKEVNPSVIATEVKAPIAFLKCKYCERDFATKGALTNHERNYCRQAIKR